LKGVDEMMVVEGWKKVVGGGTLVEEGWWRNVDGGRLVEEVDWCVVEEGRLLMGGGRRARKEKQT